MDMFRVHSFKFPSLLVLLLVTITRYVTGHVVEAFENIERRQQELSGAPSASDFLNRAFHATGQLGDYLYIDGGELAFNKDGSQLNLPDNQTYSIDLTKAWNNSTIEFTAIDKSAPVLNYIQLWTDRIKMAIYAYGGEQSFSLPLGGSRPSPPNSLWKFKPDDKGSGTWSEVSSTRGFDDIHRSTAAYYASGAHVGIMLGGYTSQGSSLEDLSAISNAEFIPSPGLVMFNYSSQTWSNRSATAFTQYGTAQYGQAHIVSGFGDYNIFAFLGGESSNQVLWHDDGSNLLSFDTISLYDPYEDKWFSQGTSGTPPNPRDRFCSVGLPGDNGTYEIFIFGGHVSASDASLGSGSDQQKQINNAMDQVFVLSLPGFTWHQADYPSENPRIAHSCEVAGNRQMIVVGGRNPAASDLDSFTFTPDPWTNGIGVFDLTEMKWSDQYNPGADPYVSPQAVKDWYNLNGKYPSKWDSNEAQAFFEQQRGTTSYDQPQGRRNGTSSSSGSSNGGNKTSSNAGAIAGGVVGGVVGLALIGVLVWFLLRRRRRQQRHTALPSTTSSAHEMSAYEDAQKKALLAARNQNDSPASELAGVNSPPRHKTTSFQELMGTEHRPEMPVPGQQGLGRHEMPG